MIVRDAVEATLQGRNPKLVERCDVKGIVESLELYGIYSVDELSEHLEHSFGALQLQLGNTAPPAFLSLLKGFLAKRATESSSPTGS
jgi:hypothetical protein